MTKPHSRSRPSVLSSILRIAIAIPLGLAFAWIGLQHFLDPAKFDAIVPPWLGWPRFWTISSGALEIVLGLGLAWPTTRSRAAVLLIALVLAMSLANLHMWLNDVPFDGVRFSTRGHVVRWAIQIALLLTLFWLSRRPRA